MHPSVRRFTLHSSLPRAEVLVHRLSGPVRGSQVEGPRLGRHHQEMPPRHGGLPHHAEAGVREEVVDARGQPEPAVEVGLGGADDREEEGVGAEFLVAGGVGVHVHDGQAASRLEQAVRLLEHVPG